MAIIHAEPISSPVFKKSSTMLSQQRYSLDDPVVHSNLDL